MKILKSILIIVVVLIALILIAALFIKKEYSVERSVTIMKPKSDVFAYARLLKNQNNFSVWPQKDPAMKTEFHGTDGTVGFISSWDSQNKEVGKGEQTIVNIVPGEKIDYNLHFIEPFESNDHAYFTFKDLTPYQTEVRWGFDGKMNYPMNVMLPFMNMEELLGKDLQNGLNKLKTILEKQ